MLQNIRDKSQGLAVKIIVGLIVVTFALFGVDALVRGFGSSDTVADVDGTEISRTQLLRAAEIQRRQLISMMGSNIDPSMLDENTLQRRAMDELIQRTVLANQAEKLNIAVSDAQVDQYLVNAEQFQTEGKFDQNKFGNFIRTLGYTPLSFKQRIKEDMVLQQARGAVTNSEFVLPGQVSSIVSLQAQQRSYDYIRFSLANELEKTEVLDAELKAYFDAHQEDFKRPEQVRLNYVMLDSDSFMDKVDVSDSELQDAYKAAIANEPDEERLASHILVETGDSRTEDEAQSIIAEIQQKLDQGESFSTLAEEYSDDIGSKTSGGDLGYVTRGMMVKPFEEALFAMEPGQISGAVESEFGLHLILLHEVVQPEVPDFESMRAELERDIKANKAADALLSAHEEITDLAYASDNLDLLAKEYGIEVEVTDWFGHEGGQSAVEANAQVIAAAFSPTVLEDKQNSGLIELDDERVVVVRLADHRSETTMPFEEVKDQVTSTLIEVKAKESLAAMAEKAIQSPEGQNWTIVEQASRGMDEITSIAFGLAHPVSGPVLSIEEMRNGDMLALRLNDVSEGQAEADDNQSEYIVRYINQSQMAQINGAYQESLVSKAKIEK